MDIAYFISDLLGQQGELTVPNLGYFVQMRMSAYYDEQEKRFYPPHYAVQFDPQVIDDDETLAAHITVKKNISLASSKYFIEKFVSNLRQQALTEEVPFGSIGSFQTDGARLAFKPGSKTEDASLFGLIPVGLYGTKVSAPTYTPPPLTTYAEAPAPTQELPVERALIPTPPEPVYSTPPAYTPPPAEVEETRPYEQQRVEPDQYVYEDEKRGLSVWAIIGIIVIVLGIAAAALYKFKPEVINSLFKEENPYSSSQPIAPVNKHTDSLEKAAMADTVGMGASALSTDTAATKETSPAAATTTTAPENKTPAAATTAPVTSKPAPTAPAKSAEAKPVATQPAVTTTAPVKPATQPVTAATTDEAVKGSWVIRAGTYPTKSGSDARIDQLKGKGFAQARLQNVNVKRGSNYKVILGVYNSKEAAHSAGEDLLATGKITRTEIFIEQIK
ncbi:sporulation related protein [Mucilaginibacter yixingensis]|uniref:Sporulation related protein n=1 Tax=Mucilaginibacter yixingensis TaxID=1295612 RepID=A0A2T5J6P9_9SPHI|nr:SPOR domain-containing protein [Mucilaginibacter yixingensis]PTQ94126.1 sporulation related protein [Mucilaginibacter yixingensis]